TGDDVPHAIEWCRQVEQADPARRRDAADDIARVAPVAPVVAVGPAAPVAVTPVAPTPAVPGAAVIPAARAGIVGDVAPVARAAGVPQAAHARPGGPGAEGAREPGRAGDPQGTGRAGNEAPAAPGRLRQGDLCDRTRRRDAANDGLRPVPCREPERPVRAGDQ